MIKRLLGAAAVAAAFIVPGLAHASTWNSSNVSSEWTLSNGNLTATNNTGGSDQQGANTLSNSSGELYAEFQCSTIGSDPSGDLFGIWEGTDGNYGTYLGDGTETSFGFQASGGYVFNASPTGSAWSGCVTGDTVGIEINFSTHTAYARTYHSGSWGSFSSGNSFSGLNGSSWYLAASMKTLNDAVEVCGGNGTCGIGPLPSGYSWWDGSSSQSFSSTSISGNSFTSGTASTVGAMSATMSPSTPAFSGTWSIKTSGTVGGDTCYANSSSYFSVSGSNLNVSASAPAGTYDVCYEATESGVTNSPYDNVVVVTGGSSGSQSFSSTSISGNSFTPGTASNVGTMSAVLSPATPAFSGTWSLKTSGTVNGKTCDANSSSWWSITSGDILNVSSSATAGTYHICYEATESGVTGSPYDNEVDVTGGVVQCGSSVTPAVSGGLYVLQCQLNGNLTINNPTGMAAGGGDSFQFELQQPATEPGTAYTVTLGTAYNQSGAPGTNTVSGLSTTANDVDDFFGVSMPVFSNVWSAQRVAIGAVLPNMGN